MWKAMDPMKMKKIPKPNQNNPRNKKRVETVRKKEQKKDG